MSRAVRRRPQVNSRRVARSVAKGEGFAPRRLREKYARVQGPARVEPAFQGSEPFQVEGRLFPPVPGHVVAADRVMVGDGAAHVDDGVGRGRLDRLPLIELLATGR